MSRFTRLLAILFLTLGVQAIASAEANYVYHEASTNNPGCGADNYRSVLTPNSSQSLTIAWKVEFQFYTTNTVVYYTTDGSTPGGAFGVGSGTTQVLTGSYSCTFGGPLVDVAKATIPAQRPGTVVKYIISAWHSGGGSEIFANGPGAPCSGCTGPITSNSSLATVFSYTVSNTNNVDVYSTGGTGAPMTSYTSLASAITAINGGTAHTGTITAYVLNGYTETAPAGGFSITATGTVSNPIVFKKTLSAGSNPVFTADVTLTSGALNDAIIKIIGGDYITIDGFTMQENAANLTTTAASNNMTEWGVALLYASTTDGAQNNTIQNCTISLNRTYTNTFGIYSNTRHSATAVSTTADATSAAGANSNNKFYGNTISNVNMGIALIGTAAAAVHDLGNDIGGSSSATGNTITNWGGAGATSGYVSNTGTSYCIFVNNQDGENVSYNTITSATISGTPVTLRGILKDYSATPTGTFTSTISNNTITITDNFTSGTLECIRSQGMTALSTATININNNTILNTSVGGTSSSTTIVGIVNSSAPGVLSMSNNIIRGTTSTATTGGFTGVSNTGAVATTINMNNNQIGNASGGAITFSAATSGAVTGLVNSNGASTCALSISSNDIRGITHSIAGTSAHLYISNSATTLSQNISSNTFTNLNVNATGNVTFISNSVSAPSGGFKTINSNSIVTAFNKTGAGGTIALYTDSGASTATAGVQNNNNNFSNITVTGATTIAGWFNNDGTGATPTKTITGNTFNNWTCGTNTVTVLQSNFGNPGNVTNNKISNISGQSTITGLSIGSSGTITNLNISTDTITGLSSTGTGGAVTGISNAASATTTNISSNVINNLSSSSTTATVAGITTSTSANIFSNTINTLSCVGTTSGVTNGIMVTAGTAVNVYKNKIYDLSTSGAFTTAPGVNGIVLSGSTASATINVYNNLIGDLRAPASTSTDAIRGLSVTATGTTSTYKLYFNTIYINASGGATFGTTGLFHTRSTTATTATLDLRNNIIVNTSTPAGTGLTVAYRRSAGVASNLANYASTSNNNLFYAGTPGASNLIYSDGTSSAQTMAAYKAGAFTAGTIAPRDAVSVSENPNFVSTTGSNANFLHINTGIATQIESGGSAVSGITDDYDGDTRNVSTPDIGADELTGIALDLFSPIISYTALSNTLCLTSQSLSATITDASSVNTTAGTKPRLWFKKSTNANALPGTNDNTTDGWKYVEASNGASPFSFSMDFSLIFGGATSGDSISYFVVAQDLVTTPNVGINSGTFSGSPTSVALATGAFPLGGTINGFKLLSGGISGTVTIGAAGNYTSLTGPGGLFSVLNAGGLTGNLTANIIDASVTETGANALNAITYGCGTYTLTIKPNTTATLTGSVSSGALIKLNGADKVVIDGSNSGGTDRSLTITNTNATAPTAISLVSLGTGAGATNNTVKNCNISTGAATSIGFGISVGGSTPGTNGADNDNVTIQNNAITVAPIGIFASGTASVTSGGNDNLAITGNSISYNSNLASIGIFVGNSLNSAITQDTVSEETTAIQAPTGIALGSGFVSSTVTRNNITKSLTTNTNGYGGRGITIATGTASSNLTIANNFISGVNGSNFTSFSNSSAVGIAIGVADNSVSLSSTAGGINLYYNTVNMTGSMGAGSTASLTTALYIGSGASALDIRNNILVNTQVGTNASQKNYAIYSVAANTAFTNINYNDYYVSNSFNAASAIPGFLSSDRTNLAGIVAGFGGNANSLTVAPVFTSSSDLHLDVNNTTV